MNIRLNQHSEQLLKEALSRGEFNSAEEVVERALETLSESAERRVTMESAEFEASMDALTEGSDKLPVLPPRSDESGRNLPRSQLMAAPVYLADTNILVRVSQREDPSYAVIRCALSSLRATGAKLCFTSQNLAELWNVCTRPAPQNGYGLNVAETDRRAQLIESGFTFRPCSEQVHAVWRRLVVVHSVMGVKVHDARLVAAMHVHGVGHLLTLDEQDFIRYSGITIVHPRQLATHR